MHYFIFALGNPFGNDEINHKVNDIAAGKLAGARGEYYKRTYNFKQIIFTTTEGKLINIILSQTEYAKYLKNLNSEDGRERFTEFVKRYGLNPDKLTTKITKRMTKNNNNIVILENPSFFKTLNFHINTPFSLFI